MNSITSASHIEIRTATTLSTNMDDEIVILDTAQGKYYGLDGVGARVWEILKTPHSFVELKNAVLEEFEVDADQCELDLVDLLGSLRDSGLVIIK